MGYNRTELADNKKWKTEDIFSSLDEFEKTYKEVADNLDFSSFRGMLNTEKKVYDFYKKVDEVGLKLEWLYLYAHLKKDEDNRNDFYNSLMGRVENLHVKFSTGVSFSTPELNNLETSLLEQFSKSELLSDYSYSLKNLIKLKKYILSEKEEKILALGGEVFRSSKEIFFMIDNADLDFPEVEDSKGEKIKLSHAMYSVCLHSEDRLLRKRAFKAYYAEYIKLLNTFSCVYSSNVRKNVFLTRARNYESCLDKALINEDVEKNVYLSLLKNTEKALPILHKYVGLRKKALRLKEMHMYDMYAPITQNAELKLEYEDAYELVVKGLHPLGNKYCELLKTAFNDGWIDVFETKGKRSGAYSSGAFGKHPYVLLNYEKTTHDIFTIAHEMGHALHSHYSNNNQPYSKADYTIFVAEVASTVNEVLLLKHILNETKDKNVKKYLLSYFLDMIRTTLFRQTMFSEFEFLAHSMVENGEPLNKENMSEMYLNLNKKYYGSDVISDDEIAKEWCRIPHFYSAFYVYKYATGIISAIAIAERILKEGNNAVDDYFEFLKSGGSDSPTNLLKKAGIDLTKEEPYIFAMKVFEDTVCELEKLI